MESTTFNVVPKLFQKYKRSLYAEEEEKEAGETVVTLCLGQVTCLLLKMIQPKSEAGKWSLEFHFWGTGVTCDKDSRSLAAVVVDQEDGTAPIFTKNHDIFSKVTRPDVLEILNEVLKESELTKAA